MLFFFFDKPGFWSFNEQFPHKVEHGVLKTNYREAMVSKQNFVRFVQNVSTFLLKEKARKKPDSYTVKYFEKKVALFMIL